MIFDILSVSVLLFALGAVVYAFPVAMLVIGVVSLAGIRVCNMLSDQ